MKSATSSLGLALPIALVLLLVIALLGVSGLGNTLLEQKMAGAHTDRQLAFEAAEAALRRAESRLFADPQTVTAPCTCLSTGYCSPPYRHESGAPDCTARWRDPALPWQSVADLDLGALVSSSPRYLIEYLGDSCRGADGAPRCRRYRILAQASLGSERATVVLAAHYQVPIR
ncbi:MAG: pilus assembly protein [Hydrogenophilus sp.]|nr:pilus assembly protein [Hydrogenophilus sp.]